ncbi:hypothetical protein Tco_0954035 [Tanacetum coccineum]|uniref:Uncharacterized protein n=1 Tax=Tanacetum coccineum TaxID=301880 RepID=A0ABQ5E1K5_9ASTR
MVCSFRLALFSFIEVSKPSGSWDELVVSVESSPSNPSLPLVLVHHLTIKGGAGFCKLPSGKGYREVGMGRVTAPGLTADSSVLTLTWQFLDLALICNVFHALCEYKALQSNPSLLFVLSSSQPLKGVRVFVYVELERFIGVLGRWEWVGVSCDGTWDSGKARKIWEKVVCILRPFRGMPKIKTLVDKIRISDSQNETEDVKLLNECKTESLHNPGQSGQLNNNKNMETRFHSDEIHPGYRRMILLKMPREQICVFIPTGEEEKAELTG